MSKDIQPGYLLKITTWENDGDNYNTVDRDGLTEDEVRFFIHVAKAFGSYEPNSIGNEELHGEELNKRLFAHIENFNGPVPDHWDLAKSGLEVDDEDEDEDEIEYFYSDKLYEIGIHSTEYGFWRVFESADVFYIPEIVKNVSSKFK